MKVEFKGPLRVQDLQPGPKWQVMEDMPVEVTNDDGTVVSVTVPANFMTDFCSIPRAPFIYQLYGGLANKSGALHDWLYQSAQYPRAWCDQVLRDAIIANGYPDSMAEAFYLAVRQFAQNHYGWKKDSLDRRDIVYKVERPV